MTSRKEAIPRRDAKSTEHFARCCSAGGHRNCGEEAGRPWALAPSLEQQPRADAALVRGRRTRTPSGVSRCGSPGGTAVSGPAGPGAAPDDLGRLPPRGPGGPQPKTEHPEHSRGGNRVRLHTWLAPRRPQRTWPGTGISQWKGAEGKGRQGPWMKWRVQGALDLGLGWDRTAGRSNHVDANTGTEGAGQLRNNMLPESSRCPLSWDKAEPSQFPAGILLWKHLGELSCSIHSAFSLSCTSLFIFLGESGFSRENQ